MSPGGTLPAMATAGRGAARPGTSGRQANRLQSCITLRPTGSSRGEVAAKLALIDETSQAANANGSASFLVMGQALAGQPRCPSCPRPGAGPQINPHSNTPALSHLLSLV